MIACPFTYFPKKERRGTRMLSVKLPFRSLKMLSPPKNLHLVPHMFRVRLPILLVASSRSRSSLTTIVHTSDSTLPNCSRNASKFTRAASIIGSDTNCHTPIFLAQLLGCPSVLRDVGFGRDAWHMHNVAKTSHARALEIVVLLCLGSILGASIGQSQYVALSRDVRVTLSWV